MAEIAALRSVITMDAAPFKQGVAQAQAASRGLQRELSAVDDAANRIDMRGVAQQLSQVAQSSMATGNIVSSLAIQLPDIGASFGTIGIAAGVAAGLILPLASNLLSAGDAAGKAEKAVEQFQAAAGDASGWLEIAAQDVETLREKYGDLAETVQLAALRMGNIKVQEAFGAVDAVLAPISGQIDNLVGSMADLAEVQREIATLEAVPFAQRDMAALDQAQIRFDGINATISRLQADLGLTASTAGMLGQAFDEFRSAANMDEQIAAATAFLRKVEDTYTAVDVMPAAVAQVYEALVPVVETGGRLNIELDEAVEGVEDMATATGPLEVRMQAMRDRMAEIAGTDLAGPFERAFESVDRLVGRLDQGLTALQGWGAAAGDWLESFNPGEMGRQLEGFTDGMEAAKTLLRQVEGFQPVGTWDVNAYRAGYGSDTVTLSDGSIKAITQGMAVNRADAERDLERRAREFAAIAMREVGADRWADILPAQQAVLTSLAYNYGNLPDAVAAAVRSGSDIQVGAAIRGLGSDNDGVNRNRRNNEAAIYAAGVGAVADAEFRQASASRAAEKATRDADAARLEGERSAREQASLTEQASSAFDQLVASIDPAAAAAQQYAQAQETINEAVQRGVISVAEGAAALEAFNRHQMENSEAAQAMLAAQEAAAEEVQGIWDGATESMADYFADGIMGGFEDGIEGAIDILKDGLKQMAAIALRNRVFIPIQTGIQAAMGGGALPGMGPGSGLLGGIGSAIGGAMSGFMGGAGSVFGGLMSGGLGGAAGAIGTALSGATTGLAGFATALGAIAAPIAIVAGLFAAFRKKTTVLDEGIRVTVKGYDALIDTFKKTKTTRLFGLVSNTGTKFKDAAPDVADPIEDAYRDVFDSVSDMAGQLGLGAEALKGFSYQFKLSLKGMTEEQQQAALTAEFQKVADAMAKTAGVTAQFIRTGETASQALQRMSTSLTAVNAAMTTLGFGLYDVSLAGADAASKFVDLFGTLDNFATATSYYFENFYSITERAQEAARQFQAGLQDLGVTFIPETTEAFRGLVDSLMEENRTQQAAGLIQLAPLFQQMLGLRGQATGGSGGAGDIARGIGPDGYSTRFDHQWAQASAVQQAIRPVLSEGDKQLLAEIRASRAEQQRLAERQEQIDVQIAINTRQTARILQEQNTVGLPPVRR